MLHQVPPHVYFWYVLGHVSSFAWLFSSLKMHFVNKTTGGPVAAAIFLPLTIIFLWFVVNVLLFRAFVFYLNKPRAHHFFRGYERAGKIFGFGLLFFGNVGLNYSTEKSIACMFTFLFLALNCLCALFCIQPHTDFGLLEFLLSACMNEALSLFGLLRIQSCLVLIACIVIGGLRYRLEPVQDGSNQDRTLPIQSRTVLPTWEPGPNELFTDLHQQLPTISFPSRLESLKQLRIQDLQQQLPISFESLKGQVLLERPQIEDRTFELGRQINRAGSRFDELEHELGSFIYRARKPKSSSARK